MAENKGLLELGGSMKALCKCGHGWLTHTMRCHVKGCNCKAYCPRTDRVTAKGQMAPEESSSASPEWP